MRPLEKQSYHNDKALIEKLLLSAATIDEVLSDKFENSKTKKNETEVAASYLAAWCNSSCGGNWNLFSKRIEKDNLTFENILSRFSNFQYKQDIQKPEWVLDSQWIVETIKQNHNPTFEKFLRLTSEEFAFEHLLIPIVESAFRKVVGENHKTFSSQIDETAFSYFCNELLKSLSELTSPVLFSLFHKERKERKNSLISSNKKFLYTEFVKSMQKTKYFDLFESKPILLRLIATIVRQWIDSTSEFVFRFTHDFNSIHEYFFQSTSASPLSQISFGLSDPHNKGRTVLQLTFKNSSKLFYKPKDLRIDECLNKTIYKLNSLHPPYLLKTPKTLTCQNYGWVESVEHETCKSEEELILFYKRAGAWLSIFHLFSGTDMHEENIIASSSYPIPIDIETILQAAETGEKITVPERHAFELAGRKISDSVSITGMLPAYSKTVDNDIFGHGGLINPENELKEIVWEKVNSDLMKPKQSWKKSIHQNNIPTLNNKPTNLSDYSTHLQKGFEEYSSFFLSLKNTSEENIFKDYQGIPVRRLIRPTRFYFLLMERLKDHRNMDNGIKWSCHLDFISRLMDWERPDDPWWSLLKAERIALSELNIPYFSSLTDNDEIYDITGVRTNTGAVSGLQRSQKKYDLLNQTEIQWQSDIIKLTTSKVQRLDSIGTGKQYIIKHDFRPEKIPLNKDQNFIEESRLIFEHISKFAIRSVNSVAWIGLEWVKDSEVFNLSPLGPDLYGGVTGVCVFLSAFSKVTGDKEAAKLSLEGIAGLRSELKNINASRFARSIGIGGSNGLGSVIYSLCVMSEILNDSSLLADAKKMSDLISKEIIEADKLFDAMDGSAGAVLSLLKLYDCTKDKEVLEKAILCGDHLLNNYKTGSDKNDTWISQGSSNSLNGFSHGASGYALSLISIALKTNRIDFATTAFECIQSENLCFSHSHSNWTDRRSSVNAENFWACQWCHGAGGIGLARIEILQKLSSHKSVSTEMKLHIDKWINQIKMDIEYAVSCVEQNYPYPFDTLCCGNLGNIELLYEYCKLIRNSNLYDESYCSKADQLEEELTKRTFAILEEEKLNGDFSWDIGDKRFNLNLFKGISGIGYSLLRRVDSSLPNILIWE